MKTINTYLNEKLVLNKDNIKDYNPDTKEYVHKYHPQNKEELIKTIKMLIKERGNKADLNDIDVSNITDMSYLFDASSLSRFNGDISHWDVSNVKNMHRMFNYCSFNGDISKWDVRNVTTMKYMFYESSFKGDNGDIGDWDVRNVLDMRWMFNSSRFKGDLFRWGWLINDKCDMTSMFNGCPLEKNPPAWYKE